MRPKAPIRLSADAMEPGSRSSTPADQALADAFDRDLAAAVRKGLCNLLTMMKPELSEVFYRAEILGQSRETIPS